MEDITKLDLYDLLGVAHDASPKDIKTAYRKSALKCHPDKNPDNPSAAQLFHRLSRALEILTDGAAKDAYDKVLKARKAAEIRNKQLDSKRRKLKEDLEKREQEAEREYVPVDAAQKLQAEIERLRKEGSHQLQEEVAIMKEQLRAEMERLNMTGKNAATSNSSEQLPRLKIQWKQTKSDPVSRYTHDSLMQRFSKYGEITGLVMSSKSRALLEFTSVESAEAALRDETGFEDSPLRISWVNRPATSESVPTREDPPSKWDDKLTNTNSAGNGNRNYEDVVLMKLRQAQERKRLIDQMQKDDLGETSCK